MGKGERKTRRKQREKKEGKLLNVDVLIYF
jgi:hypothetical protein